MTESPERRNDQRISIRLPIVMHGPDGAVKHGTTENVSRRGMLLVAQGPASKGTLLRVAITGVDGRERDVAAEVVRATPEGRLAVIVAEHSAGAMREIVEAGGSAAG